MMLVDTGPLIALFDPKDGAHDRCRDALQQVREPLQTTLPVLTEAFHILSPNSLGSDRLRDFIMKGCGSRKPTHGSSMLMVTGDLRCPLDSARIHEHVDADPNRHHRLNDPHQINRDPPRRGVGLRRPRLALGQNGP